MGIELTAARYLDYLQTVVPRPIVTDAAMTWDVIPPYLIQASQSTILDHMIQNTTMGMVRLVTVRSSLLQVIPPISTYQNILLH